MRVGAAGQLGVGSVGAAGGPDRMRVGPARGLGLVPVGATGKAGAGKTGDGVSWSSWGTGMILVAVAGGLGWR